MLNCLAISDENWLMLYKGAIETQQQYVGLHRLHY